MDTGIKITAGKAKPESTAAMADAITQIIQAGFACHSSQETIRAAFEVLSKTGSIENCTITGCSIQDGK